MTVMAGTSVVAKDEKLIIKIFYNVKEETTSENI